VDKSRDQLPAFYGSAAFYGCLAAPEFLYVAMFSYEIALSLLVGWLGKPDPLTKASTSERRYRNKRTPLMRGINPAFDQRCSVLALTFSRRAACGSVKSNGNSASGKLLIEQPSAMAILAHETSERCAKRRGAFLSTTSTPEAKEV
jgi:hypothetical protein